MYVFSSKFYLFVSLLQLLGMSLIEERSIPSTVGIEDVYLKF